MASSALKQLAFRYLPASLLRYARSVHYQRSLRDYDMAMEPDLLGCKQLIRPGDTVLDIGGNIGVYTRFCSEFVGSSGRVFTLEPVPQTFAYLQSNVRALGLRNVECRNVAASDVDSDDARMMVPDYATGGENLYEASLSEKGNIPVRTARLDRLFPELRPSFIKIDVEGHEVACLKGAAELLKRAKPALMIEVLHEETFAIMEGHGYRTCSFSGSSFQPRVTGEKRTNWFFLPDA